MDRVEKTGAGFLSLTEAFDTTLPAGRMMMQMVGSFAEFECVMLRERTHCGLLSARESDSKPKRKECRGGNLSRRERGLDTRSGRRVR
jgi:DNA invertase Pin-like site-specific DNA recombinase